MAGIFALTTNSEPASRKVVAETLAKEMCLFPWQSPTILHLEKHQLILGSISNNNSSQPRDGFYHQEGEISCVVEGYFVRASSDCGASSDIQSCYFAKAAIRAYKKFGDKFPEKLEGAFVVILHDGLTNKLISGNGKFASSLLYNYRNGQDLIYCTQLGPMAKCGYFHARPDYKIIGHLLCHGGVFARETIVEEVEAYQPATIGIHDLKSGIMAKDIYWTVGSVNEHDYSKSFAHHLSNICDSLIAAGERITNRPGRLICGLSGGLDSRLVTGIAHKTRPDLKTWTFGSSQAPDMISAKSISKFLDVEHLPFPTRPDLVPEYSDTYSATVDGFVSADFAYGIERTTALMGHGDIVLNGFAGEVILGGYTVGPRPKIIYDNLRRRKLWGPEVIAPTLAKHKTNESLAAYFAVGTKATQLTPHVTVQPDSYQDRVLQELDSASDRVPLPFRGENFFLSSRVGRWTLMGIISDRHFYSDGSLFYDYDVLDSCMATPHQMRQSDRMYTAVFRTLIPELGTMINANTGFRADASHRQVYWNKIIGGLGKKIRKQPASKQVTGNDPNYWSRNIYPKHYQDILSDKRTGSRGFWDIDGLSMLLEKHLSGDINAGPELGQLASVEFFCRRWLD